MYTNKIESFLTEDIDKMYILKYNEDKKGQDNTNRWNDFHRVKLT